MNDELLKNILLNKNEPSNQDEMNDALKNIGPEELSMLAKLYAGQDNLTESKTNEKNFKSFLPEPGICFKTKNLRTNQKIFLNICQSSEINAPKDITEQELLKIIEQEDQQNAAFQFRVPMSLGEAHTELDNSGTGCTAYDICINPEFLQKIQKYPTFMGFLISIIIEGLEEKYSIKIDKNCKLLKNKKFLGQIKEQYIRLKSKPLIAEVNTNENRNQDLKRPEAQCELSCQIPKYKIFREPQDGELVEFLVAEIELPNIKSANSIILDIGEDRILLNTRSKIYYLDIYLPYFLNQSECGAQFDKKTKILTITMPVSN